MDTHDTEACVFPAALVAEGVDGVLYKGPGPAVSPQRGAQFQRKPPHLDFAREFKVAGSYQEARATVDALTKRHRLQQLAREERFDRAANAAKFTAQFAETRLGTCGVPTLNTVGVIIDRQRRDAESKRTASNQHERSGKRPQSTKVEDAVRRAYGSQTLDLKALELIHIPEQVYTTMLLQLARLIRCVNVSRNALREIPTEFCDAFPEAEVLLYKENALDTLPPRLAALQFLKHLNVECNELVSLPLHLPVSLEILNASRNRLTQVPNLHALTKLLDLDLSHNHFQVPPSGLMYLTKLKHLTLSGNRLVTLALPLKFVQVHDAESSGDQQILAAARRDIDNDNDELLDPEQAKKRWRVQVDPETQDTVYFHVATKTVTRIKPKCFQIYIPKLLLNSGNGSGDLNAAPTKTSDSRLASSFPGGWEIKVDESTSTDVAFVNHLDPGASVVNRVPPELDRLGDLSFLQTLCVSGNQLLDLPPSIVRSWFPVESMRSKCGVLISLMARECAGQADTLEAPGSGTQQAPCAAGHAAGHAGAACSQARHERAVVAAGLLHEVGEPHRVRTYIVCMHVVVPTQVLDAARSSLDLKLNRFQHLHERFGALTRLETLDVSANALESLPRSFLELKKLTTLKLQNNPQLTRTPGGGFRPETLASGDIEQVMWQLTHQLQCELRGAQPPVPESRVVGVGDECWSTNIHLHKEFTHAIAAASTSTGVLDFHWKNLTLAQFPSSFYSSLSHLRELRLSGHNLDVIPSSFSCLASLRVLHLRKNKIRELADDVFVYEGSHASQLIELDLEYNLLETLPTSIANLTKLAVLRASNNRLSTIPASIEGLHSELREVFVAHNLFQQPPSGLGSLLHLEKLDISYNRLTTLASMDFARLQHLRSLRLNVNQLETLPESLGKTRLEELWIAGNRFVDFPPAILALKPTLSCLRMQSNKLYRLPVEFGELASLEDVQSDGNPFQSPPPEVMNLEIRFIRAYLLKRQQRIREISELLATNRFPFDPSCFRELKVRRLIVWSPSDQVTNASESEPSGDERQPDSLKFLTRKHLAAFDRVVDQYVNGTFYLFDMRGADLVNGLLLKTQFELAQRHREQVLADLLKLCRLIKTKRWADKVDFRYDCDRPWGRHGEDVGVYLLNPAIIYEDQAPRGAAGAVAGGVPPPPAVPSILNVIKMRVRHGFESEAFTRTRDEVRDAVENYVGLYGPIGIVHDNVPFKCGCEELLRYNKMHEPCYRPGWAFLQVIYTEEEAARRVSDETTIADALHALRPQIETFLKTPEGEKRFHKEVKLAKDQLRRELTELARKLDKTRKKHAARAKALNKVLAAEAKLQKADPAAAADAAAQRSVADVKARAEDVEEVKTLAERVKTWTTEYETGKARLGSGYAAFLDAVVTKLLERVGAQVKNHLIQQQRTKAIEFGWRRPWDGRNGREFDKFKLLVRRTVLEDGTMASESKPRSAPAASAGDGDAANGECEDDDGNASDNSEISDVSFEGYEDLVRDALSGVHPGHEAAGGDDDDDEGGDDGDDDDDDDEDERRANADLADLVVSDVSDDDADGAQDDSEDSEI